MKLKVDAKAIAFAQSSRQYFADRGQGVTLATQMIADAQPGAVIDLPDEEDDGSHPSYSNTN
jgi:hypothetical protein